MATILDCGICKYPISFASFTPAIMSEKEKEVKCPRCGSAYIITIRMSQGPKVEEVEKVKNRPSA